MTLHSLPKQSISSHSLLSLPLSQSISWKCEPSLVTLPILLGLDKYHHCICQRECLQPQVTRQLFLVCNHWRVFCTLSRLCPLQACYTEAVQQWVCGDQVCHTTQWLLKCGQVPTLKFPNRMPNPVQWPSEERDRFLPKECRSLVCGRKSHPRSPTIDASRNFSDLRWCVSLKEELRGRTLVRRTSWWRRLTSLSRDLTPWKLFPS